MLYLKALMIAFITGFLVLIVLCFLFISFIDAFRGRNSDNSGRTPAWGVIVSWLISLFIYWESLTFVLTQWGAIPAQSFGIYRLLAASPPALVYILLIVAIVKSKRGVSTAS